MQRIIPILLLISAMIFLAASCDDKPNNNKGDATAPTTKPVPVNVPAFSADSAYAYIEKQLAFGARVPGTPAHRACGDWMVAELKKNGATVIEQTGQVEAWDLDGNQVPLPLRNIIASYNPDKGRRILFSAHWDTRPFADQGTERKDQPIPGANDGGSGVAVLMEMARHFGKENPNIGIDLIFWDVEDHGNSDIDDSYCLGSQYWGRTPHKAGYGAMYGINLDMVGAKGAAFIIEGYSMNYGKPIVDMVWNQAVTLGYGKQFIFQQGGYITDDHVYITQASGIPVIDIIDQRPSTGQTFFGQWHTHQDDIHIIDKETLRAVGETMMHVAYKAR